MNLPKYIIGFDCVMQKYNPSIALIFGVIYQEEKYGENKEFRESPYFISDKGIISYGTVLRGLKILLRDNLIINTNPEAKGNETKHYKINKKKLIELSAEIDLINKIYDEEHSLKYELSLSYINPRISNEWLYSKNNLSPDNVKAYSTEEVYWQCSDCGHKWWAVIANRSNGRDCPKCAILLSESKISNKLKEYILENYKSETEYKIFKNPKTNRYLPYDIYIYDDIFIEIHGLQHYLFVKYWHKNQEGFEYSQYKDKIKKEYARENGSYIEVDLRKIKSIEEAIEYVENILSTLNVIRKE